MEPGAGELIEQGDAYLKSGDVVAAVQCWRAAGTAGLEQAAAARLKALIRSRGRSGSIDRSVPRRALGPLKVLGITVAFGTLAFFASDHGPGQSDVPLVWLGWLLYGIATASALLFALRSGPLDGRTSSMRAIDSLPFAEIADHAEGIANQLKTQRQAPMSAEAAPHA
jgi:hypothetical protein